MSHQNIKPSASTPYWPLEQVIKVDEKWNCRKLIGTLIASRNDPLHTSWQPKPWNLYQNKEGSKSDQLPEGTPAQNTEEHSKWRYPADILGKEYELDVKAENVEVALSKVQDGDVKLSIKSRITGSFEWGREARGNYVIPEFLRQSMSDTKECFEKLLGDEQYVEGLQKMYKIQKENNSHLRTWLITDVISCRGVAKTDTQDDRKVDQPVSDESEGKEEVASNGTATKKKEDDDKDPKDKLLVDRSSGQKHGFSAGAGDPTGHAPIYIGAGYKSEERKMVRGTPTTEVIMFCAYHCIIFQEQGLMNRFRNAFGGMKPIHTFWSEDYNVEVRAYLGVTRAPGKVPAMFSVVKEELKQPSEGNGVSQGVFNGPVRISGEIDEETENEEFPGMNFGEPLVNERIEHGKQKDATTNGRGVHLQQES